MFNTRRIHTARPESRLYISLDRGTENSVCVNVYNNVTDVVNERPFKFARRSFAGATRLNFVYNQLAGYGMDGCFVSTEPKVWLCASKCHQILGVGRRTKKFSIWYKVI